MKHWNGANTIRYVYNEKESFCFQFISRVLRFEHCSNTFHSQVSGKIRDLNQAWDLYYHVFRKISRQLPQLTSLELQYVSPKLLACKDLELAVPGSYTPGQELIRISSIHQNLQVNSIQFPFPFHRIALLTNLSFIPF